MKNKHLNIFSFLLIVGLLFAALPMGEAEAATPTGFSFIVGGTGTAEISQDQYHSANNSVKLATVTTSDRGMVRFEFAPDALKLDDLSNLSYWEYVDTRENPLDVFIDIWLDFDGNGVADTNDYPGYLQAEPYYTVGAAPLDTWTYIDAMSLKWTTYVGPNAPYEGPTIYNFQDTSTYVPGPHNYTMNDWTKSVDFGQLDILRVDIRVGYGGTWANFTGYADDIIIDSYVEAFPPNEVWVCTTGSCGHPGVEFSTIQAGINAVAAGGTVNVAAGTYNETAPLTINKPNLTVKSTSGAETTVINATNSGLYNGVEVLKDLGDVTFEGFTVQNFTQDGIKQSYTQKQGTAFHVLNNIVIPQDDYLRNGIEVTGDGSTVIGNTIYGKLLTTDWASCGIQVDDASDVIVENNIIDGDPLIDYGICVAAWDYDIDNVLIQGNTISNAETAIGLMTGIYTPQTISNVSILSNHLSDSNLGIGAFTSEYNSSLLTLTLGGTIKLEDNQFDGIVDNDFVVGENVVGASGLAIDASPNWWGQITGPTIADILAEGTFIPESSIAFTPWCGDSGCTFTVPDGNGEIVLDGEYDVPGGFEINVPGLTIILNDGTVIENESPCFIVNADYTTIKAASIGGAQCIPTGDDNGIDVAAGLENIIIEGLEFVGTDGTDGIHFAGAITDVVIVDNWFHDFAEDGIEFTAQPIGVIDIQGNLFQDNDGLGINAPTFTVGAEYNAWGHYTAPVVDTDISANVDADPWTHVDLYLISENPDVDNWLNQVFVGETITYNVIANLVNAMGAVFVLEYPSNLTIDTTGLGDQFESELLDTSIAGKLTFTGYQTVDPAITGEDLTLFSVTFNAVTPDKDLVLNLDETTDTFSMAPAAGPSNNIYATALDDITSLDVITRPTLNIVGLNGPFVAGISQMITNEICNAATGGEWIESVPAGAELPDTIGWIRISDITIAEIASMEFLYDGLWYDFSVQDAYGGSAVQQDVDDVIARFGNYNFGMEVPVDWCDYDAFRVTFLNPGAHDVSVELYDMMDTPYDGIDPDDILLASFGPVAISIDGDFAITGTVSMQGRTNRAGVPMTLTKQGSPVYGPFNETSINVISNNISFTGVNGGIYEITTAQPRYLNVTADLDKQFLVNAAYLIDALELKGGNAVWSDNVINTGDASLVGTYYGQTIGNDADVNFSGKVDIFDLALVGGNFDLTSAMVYENWLVPEFNGTVAGIIDDTGGVITGEVSGDYNLVITGTPTGGDGTTYVTFTGSVSGDIDGTVTGTLKFMGLDSLYAIISGTGSGETVRLFGNFLQSGIDGHFVGTIVTGPELDPLTSMSITGGDTVVAGQTLQLTAITDPAGRDVLWSVYVNNRPYGTIDMETGLLTGLQPGTVTVIAVAVDDSNLSFATKVITITAAP